MAARCLVVAIRVEVEHVDVVLAEVERELRARLPERRGGP